MYFTNIFSSYSIVNWIYKVIITLHGQQQNINAHFITDISKACFVGVYELFQAYVSIASITNSTLFLSVLFFSFLYSTYE